MFEKELSETDTKHRLSFPTEHLNHLLTLNSNQLKPLYSPIDFRVVDLSGNPYTLRLRVRKEGYLKPEITGDWLHIIRAKNLKPFDRVIFYKHPITSNGSGVMFTIAVRRAVRVFGVVFGYAQLIE